MKTRWILLIALLSVALGSCGPSQTVVEDSPPPAPADKNMVSPITPDTTTIAIPTVIESGAWKTYQNTQAGYSANYPADWTVNEIIGANGELTTSFVAPNDGQGIVVSILNADVVVEEIPDMPNTRCQQVTISGLSGRRCFDTIASNISITFLSRGRQYTIATFGKHLDQDIYQHFLDNLTLTP